MYSSGRAPAATPEQLRESKQSFKNAMAQFGVLDADMVDARRNKRKYKAAYFDNRSGGYYVVQKGHLYNRDELEAAKILALHGLQVVMQPEGDNSGGVSLRVSSSTGRNTYPEGLIGTLWYEQYSTSDWAPGITPSIKVLDMLTKRAWMWLSSTTKIQSYIGQTLCEE